jgi:ABC-type hemin transport system ATPase subunit
MYKILSITLVGYRRMRGTEIRKITITPHAAVQLILGSNGSGKSSLLHQLTPLPSEKDDFIKGGSKTVHIESGGHTFICATHVDRAAEHSFIMNDEELNTGGTAQVQRDLCWKYFKVTPATHEMMLGMVKFTQLKPPARREWLMSLCESDNDFALDAYDKLNKRANHLTGAVKMNQKNLGVEVAKIMSEEEEAKLEQEVNALRQELNILQSERMPVEQSSQHYLDERTRALRSLNDVATRLLRLQVVAPYQYECWWADTNPHGQPVKATFRSLNEVDMEIDRLKHIATGKEAVLVTVNEQYSKLQHQHDILIKTGAEGVESIDNQIHMLRDERTSKVGKLRLELLFPDAFHANEALQAIFDPLVSALREIPENGDRRYGRSQYESMQQQLLLMITEMNKHIEYLHRLKAQKEHADLHRGKNQHVCPSCDHSWVVGVDEKQYELIVAGIKEGEAKLKAMKEAEAQQQKSLEVVEGYFGQYREIIAYTKSVTILNPFWDYLLDSKLILESPLEAVNALQYLQRDLLVSIDVQHIEEKLEELTKLRAQAAEVGNANLNEVRAQMEAMADKLGQLTAELSHVQRSVSAYSEYRRQLNTGLQLGEELQKLSALAEQQQYSHIEAFRRESIHHCLREVENAMALKEESLRAVKRQKELVGMLRSQIATLEIQEAAAKAMVAALSPKNGLIAEGLLGFIRAFVGAMNVFINRIWSYPLQIIPTGYDSVNREQTAELDYKFKVVVEREDNLIKDVSLGSEGIKEIIDLAFMFVAIKYMNLGDTPLFLDEPGRAFDDNHSNELTVAIKWVMDNTNCPQLWMISHHAVNYTAFSNAEICMIDERNVVIPDKPYNKHVVIERHLN